MLLSELNEKLLMNNYEPIYEMENLYKFLYDKTPSQVKKMAEGNDFNFRQKYFTFDKFGNLKSYESLAEILKMYDMK